jgi:hypothetical protein
MVAFVPGSFDQLPDKEVIEAPKVVHGMRRTLEGGRRGVSHYLNQRRRCPVRIGMVVTTTAGPG